MRCYHFQNMYLAGVQAGVQTNHVQEKLAIKYADQKEDDYTRETYVEWAMDYKTIIRLDGGMHSNLIELKSFLESPDNCYPWSYFNESEEALAGAMTNVGIILPFYIYGLKDYILGFLSSESKDVIDGNAPASVTKFNDVIIKDEEYEETYLANIHVSRSKKGSLDLSIYRKRDGVERESFSCEYIDFDIQLIKKISSATILM
jgi:hypothetical protein